MQDQKSQITSTVKLFRKSLLFKALLILMIFVDLIAVFFAPIWVFVMFLIIHVIVFGMYITSQCLFLTDLLDLLL